MTYPAANLDTFATALAAAILTLAGCAAPAATQPRTEGANSAPRGSFVEVDNTGIAWDTRGESIVVRLWGSSCPAEFSSIEVLASDEIEVSFKSGQSEDEVCLEYLTQWDTTVTLPSGVTETPLKVSLENVDAGTVANFTLQ